MRLIRLLLIVFALIALAVSHVAADNGWSRSSLRQPISSVQIAPDGTVYALGDTVLFRSADEGVSWQPLAVPSAGALRHLAIDPLDSNLLYVIVGPDAPQQGLFRSSDGGRTWHQVYQPAQGWLSAVAVSRIPAHRVIVGVSHLPDQQYGVLESDNQGATWRVAWAGQRAMGGEGIASLAAPSHAVIAAYGAYHGGGLVVVGDEGQPWTIEGGWNPQGVGPYPRSPMSAPREMRITDHDGLLYVRWASAIDAHLAALRTTADFGHTWQDITPPLCGRSGEQAGSEPGSPRLTALAVDPTRSAHLFTAASFGATQGEGPCAGDSLQHAIFETWDSGATWQAVNSLAPGAVTSLAYVASEAKLLATIDNSLWQYTAATPDDRIAVVSWFRAYYDAHDGWRLLGSPLRASERIGPYPSQMFEKGRVEDHSIEERDPNWRVMYGLLVDALIQARAPLPVGGDESTVSYADLADAAAEHRLLPAPAGFRHGVAHLPNGDTFIPLDAYLNAAPGHSVPPVFWQYINRRDLFPGGWLHDLGLPVTEPMTATVTKGDLVGRPIQVQAFQRAILTYDPLNPRGWQVERANVGRDYMSAFPGQP
ncbi:MAG: hypothetical protein KIS91_01440 [Anaerolineae bacterium]|nr:hypothetical protein [Anaerolineae bacterium]